MNGRLNIILAFSFTFLIILQAEAQKIAQRIPKEAGFVTVINTKEILKHSNAKLLNELLIKINFFDTFQQRTGQKSVSLEDMGVDLEQYSYLYSKNTDSISCIGYILPLNNREKFEAILPDTIEKVATESGFLRARDINGTLLAWNKDVLYILSGGINANFFYSDSVATRYGIDNVDMAAMPVYIENGSYDKVADAAPDSIYSYTEEGIDSLATVEQADSASYITFGDIRDEKEVTFEAYDFDRESTDTINVNDIWTEEDKNYSDSIARIHERAQQKNDSIRNVLEVRWMDQEMQNLLSADHKGLDEKTLKVIHEKMPLMRAWVKNVDELYLGLLPLAYMSSWYYGFKPYYFRYGYGQAFVDLQLEEHTLKLKTRVDLDKDLLQVARRIYNQKPNPKFFRYFTAQTVGFLSLNINSEAYIKELPEYISKRFGYLFGKETEIAPFLALAMDVAFDEQALARIMPGDHLVLLNGVTKLKTEYTDYEYNNDYDLKEVKRTKEETVPRFVWMFTSKDQRLLVRGLQLAVAMKKAVVNNDIYQIERNSGRDMPIYMMYQEDLVFVSNDRTDLEGIRESKTKPVGNKHFERIIKDNKFSAVIQTNRIPALLRDMDIPVSQDWRTEVDELAGYGDVMITSKGIVKDQMVGEISVTFPEQQRNGLEYLLMKLMLQLSE
ncbi:hypothetical protein [Sphingobacterium spiritivorum]|uniref:hypothetical protein n=1 Tax=Sphingobacterium spiritivorum TaxID=258 RepID=UPI00191A2CC1|nr:hypothetical protein [Sphingobacterium spiritivorum]QQT25050.1 hypothetical protein I6J02_15135 [Sphingobacterium spiritivorum]